MCRYHPSTTAVATSSVDERQRDAQAPPTSCASADDWIDRGIVEVSVIVLLHHVGAPDASPVEVVAVRHMTLLGRVSSHPGLASGATGDAADIVPVIIDHPEPVHA